MEGRNYTITDIKLQAPKTAQSIPFKGTLTFLGGDEGVGSFSF
jgi:hypothetical protein